IEVARSISGVARKQDVVMRPFHDADGIELHIAELADQRRHRAGTALLPDAGQPMARQNQRARRRIRNVKRRLAQTANASPFGAMSAATRIAAGDAGFAALDLDEAGLTAARAKA